MHFTLENEQEKIAQVKDIIACILTNKAGKAFMIGEDEEGNITIHSDRIDISNGNTVHSYPGGPPYPGPVLTIK